MIEQDIENTSEQNPKDFKNTLISFFSNWQVHMFLVFLAIRAVNKTDHSKLAKARYYLAYSIFLLMLVLCCVLCTPLMMLRPKNPLNMIVTYPFACITSFLLGVEYELRGREILAKDEAGVMVVNHQSSLDVLAHCRIMNVVKRCVIVSRKELLYFLPYSIFMTLAGSVFIDRKGGQSSNETLLKTCSVLTEHKSKLLIYPEGTRTLNAEKLKPFKKGGFRVAITAQIPVLPTVISPFYFVDARKKHFTSGKVIIKALDPIPTKGLTLDDIDELIEKTWNVMSKEYENLKNEIAGFHS